MVRTFVFLQLLFLSAIIEIAAEQWEKPPSLTGNPGDLDPIKAQKYESILRPRAGAGTRSRGNSDSKHRRNHDIPVSSEDKDRKLQEGYYNYYYPPSKKHKSKLPKGYPGKGEWIVVPPEGKGGTYPPGKGGTYPPEGKGEYPAYPIDGKGGYYPYYPSKGGKGGSSKGAKGGDAGKGYYPEGKGYYPEGKGYYPEGKGDVGMDAILDDIPLLDDSMFDDGFFADGECHVVTFNETFFFLSPAATIPLGGSPTAVGTQYVFSQNIFSADGTMIDDTLVSGTCTRTSTTGVLGTSGAGVCNLNFVDVFGNYTIAAQGYLDTIEAQVSAGNMAVTGGSGKMVSLVGEMNIIPVDNTGVFSTADLFTGIFAYFIQAEFGVIVCPNQHTLS